MNPTPLLTKKYTKTTAGIDNSRSRHYEAPAKDQDPCPQFLLGLDEEIVTKVKTKVPEFQVWCKTVNVTDPKNPVIVVCPPGSYALMSPINDATPYQRGTKI